MPPSISAAGTTNTASTASAKLCLTPLANRDKADRDDAVAPEEVFVLASAMAEGLIYLSEEEAWIDGVQRAGVDIKVLN